MRRILTANGEYYLFCAPQGKLCDGALSILRAAALTGADLIYADETAIGADGKQRPVVKPGPSPDTLLSFNYIGSPMAVSAALLDKAGPPASISYAEQWAFTMRAFFGAEFVLHIPRVLFTGDAVKPEADINVAARQLERLGRAGTALPARTEGMVSIRYDCPPETLLSVVVAVQDSAEALQRTLESLELWNTELRTEYVVVHGGAPCERSEAYYRALSACGVRVLHRWHEPNLARLFNMAANEADGEALLFLRAGDRIMSADALRHMLSFAMQPHVGAVCAWTERPEAAQAYVKNVGRILRAPMLSRDKLIKAGGFDESLAQDGCEAALAQRLLERRLHLIKTPDAVIAPSAQKAPRDEKTGSILNIGVRKKEEA